MNEYFLDTVEKKTSRKSPNIIKAIILEALLALDVIGENIS